MLIPPLWLLSVFGLFGPYGKAIPRPFTAEAWKDAGPEYWRCGMIADLEFRVGLVGRSRAEIEAMLGPSEDERNAPALSYWYLCPSFLDVYVLEIRWQNGRAVEARTRDT